MNGHTEDQNHSGIDFGYSYCKNPLGEDGNPEDYVFLDINPRVRVNAWAYSADIVNKKVTDLIENIETDSFDWIDFSAALP
jgi:hypothetical protein